ncbi:MAG: sugar phosphate isomerase/epimerase [Spirochaetales bacterium]|nr:sugar phosphate isomerase/epimerase [Spirochaetales bacterium]
MQDLSFSTAGLYPRLSIKALQLIEEAGFTRAELMPQCTHETTPEFAKEVKKLGITVDSIHFPLVFFGILYNPYPGMVLEARKLNDNLVNMGYEMGTRVIVIHPVGRGSTIDPAVLESLVYLCEVGEKAGIQIVLENHPKGGRTPEEQSAAAKMIGHRNLQLMLDVTESWECDVDPLDFVQKVDLAHLHLSDFSDRGKHLPPGEGDVKWNEFFAALKRKNYSGRYVIEPVWRYYTEGAAEKLVKAREFIENCL